MTDALQVVTTVGTRDQAEKIAEILVERRLAACVQILGPLESVYRWQGRLDHATEWQCTIKTSRRCWPELESVVRELHTYDVPELIAMPVVAGGEDYLAWLAAETTAPT